MTRDRIAPRKADALLFDLGGVVIDIDFGRAFAHWAACAGCDPALVRERFAQDEPYRRHEIGAIAVEEYFASLRKSLGLELTHAQLLEGWNAIYLGEVPGVAAALAQAAQSMPLYAFTNTNRAHELFWTQKFAATLEPFKKVFISSTIGLRKPDPEAFDYVVREIGVPAHRIVFFDDNLSNVEGARACGLEAVHIRSVAEVPAAIAAALG